ncbi:MAG: hypothetical protein QM503_05955 [Bacteroidota bacterium]
MKHKVIFFLLVSVISLSYITRLQAQNTENQTKKQDSTIILSEVGNSLHFNQEQIQRLPFHNLSALGLMAPSAYCLKGDRMFYYGIESTGNHTFVDGMQIGDASNFPVQLIQSYSLFTNQAPINMGFTTGGITAIETLNQLNDFTILFDVSTDQAWNAQGIKGEMFINIPLFASKNKTSGKQAPSLLIAGKYYWTNNTDPVWKRTQKLNTETLALLTGNPLRPDEIGSITYPNSAYVTEADMMDQKVPDNTGKSGIYPYVKLSLPISRNINLNIGNYSVIDETEIYDNSNAIFNPIGNATRSRQNFDTYINWNQNIKVNEDLTLNYDFNLQYSNYYYKIRDKRHEDRFFDYGYVGKFTTYKMPTFELGSDSVDGVYYENIWVLNSWDFDTLVTFESSNVNPGLSAYTSNYYDIYSGQPTGHYQNLSDIILGGGRVNGMASPSVYGLYNNTGSVTAGYRENSFEKIRTTFQLKADYKAQHFTIGGEYNRETQSHFSISPNGLWNIIRDGSGLTNFHLRELDKDNPQLITYNGHADTIIYFRKYDANSQRDFDKNLRAALGLPVDGLDYIVTDSYDKEKNTIDYFDKYGTKHTISTPENLLSLDLFSVLELLNGGLSLVNYAGYDYTGSKQKGNGDPYSFYNDFTIEAAKPEYWSVFIQDEFKFKNLRVRLGLRMDVYDANRPVIKDEYSLFPINNVSEALAKGEVQFTQPGNIDDDYLVYVDKVISPSKVVGYRKGNRWYKADGIEISDPTIFDVGNGISPYLSDPTINRVGEGDWTPDLTFQDYDKSVNLLPQISLDYTFFKRFNVYSHYSSFTQNPRYYSGFRPDIYYFWNNIAGAYLIPNTSLKPMRANKFFVGFKSNFWKNMVTDVSYFVTSIENYYFYKYVYDAYPIAYSTVINIDKDIITKGMEVKLDLINQGPTGAMAGMSFTKLFPKEEDYYYFQVSDMVINAFLGYRFGNKDNGSQVLGNITALQGFSASIYYQYRHGVPYRYTDDGMPRGFKKTPSVNLFNLNIQKDFLIGNKARMNIYLTIENLFNFKNVFDVYSETGEADDDGFLSNPANEYIINDKLNPDSYRLLYQLQLYSPQYYDIPRIWRIGLVFRY